MYLGLDIGTSLIKAALFDTDGREVAVVERRMAQQELPIGWSEQEPEALWRAVCAVLREISRDGRTGAIRGLGITGVMVGACVLDGAHTPLTPIILWNDARAQPLVDGMVRANPSLISDIFALSGSVMQMGCTLPVLAWLKSERPEVFEPARHVVCLKDYVRLRLTGEVATDESEAATAPGNARTRTYDKAQAERLGVGNLFELLPPVRTGETLAGRITAHAAEATGLAAGLPVAIGTGDVSAAVVGVGATEPGQAVSILGTTCLNGLVFDHPVFEPRDQGLLFPVPGGRWLKTLVNVAGTTTLDWTLETLAPDFKASADPYVALGALAAEADPGAGGVLFVPYLSASGVIAPRIAPGARAGFSGLAPQHGRAEMVRAVYEGVAYAIRHCFAAMGAQPHVIRLAGGGAKSPLWSQMIADVCARPVEIAQGTQFGAKGAALCAAVAIGDHDDIEQASRAAFTLQRRFEPDPARGSIHDAGFARYLAASEAALVLGAD
ncbi:FGGY-family carbohydrate kinase [Pelagibacterium montanilacus]|uniref:FGGY-family carbohydrate kinase n=1 Tax=Pelagibacterium montanilacus TaxID=2185280 RepID=UPI000F8D7E3D|nr:FGGY-family carbohydrate kinase [Pelagibacterium montanilacus]